MLNEMNGKQIRHQITFQIDFTFFAIFQIRFSIEINEYKRNNQP